MKKLPDKNPLKDSVEANRELAERLVRFEHQIEKLPLWAPSIYADERVRSYTITVQDQPIEIRVQSAGEYGQLRAQDKLVLAALMRLWHDQGRDPTGFLHCPVSVILDLLGYPNDGGKRYKLAKESLYRLRFCGIQNFTTFFDPEDGTENTGNTNPTILLNLDLYEKRKATTKKGAKRDQLIFDFSRAQFHPSITTNLLKNYTRPMDVRFLTTLSERGILFEAYVNGVLYRRPKVRKDVFELWEELGLSTKGEPYGSGLKKKMISDLEKLLEQPTGFLGNYRFEKSKTRPRSLNIILTRRAAPVVDIADAKRSLPQQQPKRRRVGQGSTTKPLTSEQHEEIAMLRSQLEDLGGDFNIRRIFERLSSDLINDALRITLMNRTDFRGTEHEIRGETVAYFVGVCKKKARELGIDLGFSTKDPL